MGDNILKRGEFELLSMEEQVKYINKFSENETLTSICNKIGIPRNTFSGRALKKGYKRNPVTKMFELTNSDKVSISTLKDNLNDNKVKSKCEVSDNEVITNVTHDEVIIKGKYNDDESILIPNQDVVEFMSMCNEFKDIFSFIKFHMFDFKELIEHKDLLKGKLTNDLVIDYKHFEGSTPIQRSMTVYNNVLEEFDLLCKDNPMFKKQDMISQALLNYINRYK